MIDALRVTWQSLKDLWEEFVLLIMINIVWTLAAILALAPLLLLGSSNPLLGLGLSFLLFWFLPHVAAAFGHGDVRFAISFMTDGFVGNDGEILAGIKDLIAYGASPRATLYLAQAAKAHAFLRGRGYATPEDVKKVGLDVLRHRIIISYEAEAEGATVEEIIEMLGGTLKRVVGDEDALSPDRLAEAERKGPGWRKHRPALER